MLGAWFTPDEGETVQYDGGPRIQSALPAVGAGLLVLAIGALVPGLPAVVRVLAVLVALAIPGYTVAQIRATEYVVTDRAVYRKTGVLGRSVARVTLEKVQNSSFDQHPLGAVVGYGNVTFDTAGGGDLAFSNVEDPQEIRRLVDEHADRAGRADEIPGSVEQWTAVLAEVRRLRAAVEAREG